MLADTRTRRKSKAERSTNMRASAVWREVRTFPDKNMNTCHLLSAFALLPVCRLTPPTSLGRRNSPLQLRQKIRIWPRASLLLRPPGLPPPMHDSLDQQRRTTTPSSSSVALFLMLLFDFSDLENRFLIAFW